MTMLTTPHPLADFARRELSAALDEQEAQLVLVSRTTLTRALNAMDEADDRADDRAPARAALPFSRNAIGRCSRIALVWFFMPATILSLSAALARFTS